MAYPHYINPVEVEIIDEILNRAFAAGYTVSVYYDDDIEPALPATTDREAITAEIAATASTTLGIHEGVCRIGFIFLVHGNDEDVVCDHTAKDEIAALIP